MDKKICIAIDAMGGENAPSKNIEGINLFSKKTKIPMIIFLTFLVMSKK